MEKTVNDHIDDATLDVTLDEYMRRDPVTLTDDDLHWIILAQRRKRALFIDAGHKRRAKKEGVERVEDDMEETDKSKE